MDHVRIDEGVKRGPRRQPNPPRRTDPETGRVEGIPADLDPDAVLALYLTEKTTSKIAEKFGVRRKTLVGWIRQQRPEQWKQAQIVRALVRKEDSEDGLDGAGDALSLARAREVLRGAQWDLERLDSPTFGPKQEITHIDGDLGERLRRSRERVIPGEAVQVVDSTTGALQHDDKSAP